MPSVRVFKHNKRFKRDSQRAAFLLCVGFGDYGVMRKVGSSVGCPLTGRYVLFVQHTFYYYSSLINSVCYVLFAMTFIECCLA